LRGSYDSEQLSHVTECLHATGASSDTTNRCSEIRVILEHMFDGSLGSDGWLSELNPEQRRAATAAAGRPLLILAGAGSGKTTTLSARVAWLIAEGVRPERILLLTFTRRAAAAMIARTRALLERTDTAPGGAVVAGTFHAVAWRLVRLHAEPLGLPSRLSVIDASDSADLIDVVRQQLGLAESGGRFPRKRTLADIYSRTVNMQAPLSQVLAEHFPWCLPQPRRDREHLPRLRGAEARRPAARPRRSSALLARARRPRAGRAEARSDVRPRTRRRVPRRQRPTGRHRRGPFARATAG
jgi:hypothetical protein